MNAAANRELTEPMREPPGTVSGQRRGGGVIKRNQDDCRESKNDEDRQIHPEIFKHSKKM